jgi:hypothetical protein
LSERGIGLVVGVTHLGCDPGLSRVACKREVERNFGLGIGEAVLLQNAREDSDVSHQEPSGLHGTIADEIAASHIYLEPKTLTELVDRLQEASRPFYEHHTLPPPSLPPITDGPSAQSSHFMLLLPPAIGLLLICLRRQYRLAYAAAHLD